VPPCSDKAVPVSPIDEVSVVYTEEDFARLLHEVERRSGQRRRHQERVAQTAACAVVAILAWLSFLPAASGEAPAGHRPATVAAVNIGPASRPAE
jgi:hypothetical protein